MLEDKRLEMEQTLKDIHNRLIEPSGLDMIELTKELVIFGSNELAEMKEPFIREVERYISSFSIEMDFYDLIRNIIDELLERGRREKAIRGDISTQIFTEVLCCLISNMIGDMEFAAKLNVTRSEAMETMVTYHLIGGAPSYNPAS